MEVLSVRAEGGVEIRGVFGEKVELSQFLGSSAHGSHFEHLPVLSVVELEDYPCTRIFAPGCGEHGQMRKINVLSPPHVVYVSSDVGQRPRISLYFRLFCRPWQSGCDRCILTGSDGGADDLIDVG